MFPLQDCTYSLDLLKGENLYCDECGILNICNQEKKKGFKPQMFLLLLYVDDENVWNDQVQYFGWQVAFWSMDKDQTKVSITVTDIF